MPWTLFGLLTVWLFRAFIFSNDMLFGADTMSLGYQARRFYADALGNGAGFPFWNPTILGGTPFIESLAGGDSLYPTAFLLLLMETHRALGWKMVVHVFIAGVGGFAWLRGLGVSRAAALVGGTAFLLAPWMVTLSWPGHDGKLFVTALTPWAFLAVHRLLVEPRLRNVLATAVVVALVILTTHFQAAYFLFGTLGAYAAFRCVAMARGIEGFAPAAGDGEGAVARPGRVAATRFGIFLAAAVWGAAIAAVQLLPALDYVTEFSRRTATTVAAEGAAGVAYSSSWSLHPEEIVGLAVPEFVGGTISQQGYAPIVEWPSGTYWGQNALKYNHEYLGIVVLLLGLLAFVGRRFRAERVFLATIGGVALLFALGTHTPVWRIFYELLPGVSLFRAPSIAILIAGFAFATLAGLGAENLLRLGSSGEDERRRSLLFGAGVAGALLMLTLLASSGALLDIWVGVFRGGDPNVAAYAAVALPFIERGFFLAFLLAVAVVGCAWGVGTGRLPAGPAVAILVVLVAVDLYRVDAPYVQATPASQVSDPDPNAQFLMERARVDEPFRVLDLAGRQGSQEVRLAAFGIELAAGHHPNDLQRYRELIGMVGSGDPTNLTDSEAVLAILNVRYWVVPGPLPEGVPAVSATERAGVPHESVIEFPTLPRARLVGRAVVRPDDQAVDYILSPAFDPAGEVVLTEPPPVTLSGDEIIGSVRWTERTPNRQRLEVEASGPALLVVADNWFPAWRARVDGEEVAVLRANHTLRAIPVPAGPHEVEFYYRSGLLRMSAIVSGIALLALLGAAAYSIPRSRRAEPVPNGG